MCWGKRIFTFGILLISISSNADPSSSLRLQKDQIAKETFFRLDFFEEGRGMILSPGLITFFKFFDWSPLVRSQLRNVWGLNYENGEVVGLFDRPYKRLRIGAVGCVVCHSGRAAGQYIVGLGNKQIDVWRMAKDVNRVEKTWKKLGSLNPFRSRAYKETEGAAMAFSQYLSNDRLGNLSQGLVPVSFIRGWFYRVQGEEVPEIPRGQVKIPALWGYGEKRELGQFCDGYGDGRHLGWALAVELAAGQKPEVIRKIYDKAVAAEKVFEDFLPPPYPFEINDQKALAGKSLFEATCARCHGNYRRDDEGISIFEAPKHIPWVVVQTDRDRLDGNTPEFNNQVRQNPLADIIQFHEGRDGYFAPRLDGIWSRFPYLHNGSVPSLWALLTPEENRPHVFSLIDSGERNRFDTEHVGLTTPSSSSERLRMEHKAIQGDRSIYYTERVGHHNRGHNFYTHLTEDEKKSLIEYLKTL